MKKPPRELPRWLLAGLDAPADAHADQAQAEAGEGAEFDAGLSKNYRPQNPAPAAFSD